MTTRILDTTPHCTVSCIVAEKRLRPIRMGKQDNLHLIGEIYHWTIGADETWAHLYFDAESCELVVIESSRILDMYPRYSGNKRRLDQCMTLREFMNNRPGCYREEAVRLVTEALGQSRDRRRLGHG